jgi:hypothetical protein
MEGYETLELPSRKELRKNKIPGISYLRVLNI